MTGNALQAVLDKAAKEAREPVATAPAAPARASRAAKPKQDAPARRLPVSNDAATPAPVEKFYRPSRDNRKFVGGHFDPRVGKQLRLIAVEDDTTVQALLEEALDLLFVKKGRAKIEDISK